MIAFDFHSNGTGQEDDVALESPDGVYKLPPVEGFAGRVIGYVWFRKRDLHSS